MASYTIMTQDRLAQYHELITKYIDDGDAKSIKAITYDVSTNPTYLKFWKTEDASGDPAYTITFPDASTLMKVVSGATENNVASFDANGQVKDSGIATSKIVTTDSDIPATKVTLTDAGEYFTTDTVEAALQQLGEAMSSAGAVTITKDTSSSDWAAVYTLHQNGVDLTPTINIPKDLVVKSGEIVTSSTTNPIVYDGTTYTDGTKFLKLVIQNDETHPIYIKVSDLVDVYTGGTATDGIITVDITNYTVTATIADGTIPLTKLTSSVQTSLGKADTALQPVSTATSGNIVSFGADGSITDSGIAATSVNTDEFTEITSEYVISLFQ